MDLGGGERPAWSRNKLDSGFAQERAMEHRSYLSEGAVTKPLTPANIFGTPPHLTLARAEWSGAEISSAGLPRKSLSAKLIPSALSVRPVPAAPTSVDAESVSASATSTHTDNRSLERWTTVFMLSGRDARESLPSPATQPTPISTVPGRPGFVAGHGFPNIQRCNLRSMGMLLIDRHKEAKERLEFMVPGDGIEPSRPVKDPGF